MKLAEYNFDNLLPLEEIAKAHSRIKGFIKNTPIIDSAMLNNRLGHELFFKAENLQKTGAFKVRGAINKILCLKEQNKLPQHIVAFSAGNHSQAVAWSAGLFGIKSTIFLPKIATKVKIQATKSYGAEVVITETRQEAEERTLLMQQNGSCLIHPYDGDDLVAGQGTACYEALNAMEQKPDAIFAACGGGGLLSGSYLAKELVSPKTQIFGVEPITANDAAISYKTGKIFRFADSPQTIADGVRSLSIAASNFPYLQRLDGFIEIDENEIYYWTQWLSHLLKLTIEPTASLAMAGAAKWLKTQKSKKRVLIILSGGNISPEAISQIYQQDLLAEII